MTTYDIEFNKHNQLVIIKNKVEICAIEKDFLDIVHEINTSYYSNMNITRDDTTNIELTSLKNQVTFHDIDNFYRSDYTKLFETAFQNIDSKVSNTQVSKARKKQDVKTIANKTKVKLTSVLLTVSLIGTLSSSFAIKTTKEYDINPKEMPKWEKVIADSPFTPNYKLTKVIDKRTNNTPVAVEVQETPKVEEPTITNTEPIINEVTEESINISPQEQSIINNNPKEVLGPHQAVIIPEVGSLEHNVLYAVIGLEGGHSNVEEARAIVDTMIQRARYNNISVYEAMIATGQFEAYFNGGYRSYLDPSNNLYVYPTYQDGINAGRSYFMTQDCYNAITEELQKAALGQATTYDYYFFAASKGNGTFSPNGNRFRRR